jgi:hypothetical protein
MLTPTIEIPNVEAISCETVEKSCFVVNLCELDVVLVNLLLFINSESFSVEISFPTKNKETGTFKTNFNEFAFLRKSLN